MESQARDFIKRPGQIRVPERSAHPELEMWHQASTNIKKQPAFPLFCLASTARGKAWKFGIVQKSLDHNPAYEAETRLVVAQLPRSCPSNRRSTAYNPNSNRG